MKLSKFEKELIERWSEYKKDVELFNIKNSFPDKNPGMWRFIPKKLTFQGFMEFLINKQSQ